MRLRTEKNMSFNAKQIPEKIFFASKTKTTNRQKRQNKMSVSDSLGSVENLFDSEQALPAWGRG